MKLRVVEGTDLVIDIILLPLLQVAVLEVKLLLTELFLDHGSNCVGWIPVPLFILLRRPL